MQDVRTFIAGALFGTGLLGSAWHPQEAWPALIVVGVLLIVFPLIVEAIP